MLNLLIRGIPKEVGAALEADAERHRRSREKHALFLIERGLSLRPADTCGEMLDRLAAEPAPDVDEQLLETFPQQRGRRSHRE